MQKDVECMFGILIGRWRILKTGVWIYGDNNVDKIWSACCALHNWLLEVDRLTDKWDGGIPVSDWERPLDQMDYDGLRESIPNAISQLSSNFDPRNYDLSGMGPGEDVVGKSHSWNDIEQEGADKTLVIELISGQVNIINKMSLSVFCQNLVTNFSILFGCNQIKWPKSKVGKKNSNTRRAIN
jgi:hypothetical protein